jgi:CoA-transferase family III
VALQLKIPLSGSADRQIAALAKVTCARAIEALSGATLLGERAALNGFKVPRLVSAGGGSRLYKARENWISLSLARADDRELLPALFCDESLDPWSDDALTARMENCDARTIVDQGSILGLSIARIDETERSPAAEVTEEGRTRCRTEGRVPLVIDLSALWAGPLATHLLQLAGAIVLKVESRTRPDSMRQGDDQFFNLLNQNKASIALDFREAAGRTALLALISKADIVVESARPRALLQLGIDANALVRDIPGLVWISITAHGVHGNSANRIGFGDDCSVAGGLTASLVKASGRVGYVGDAIADPLAGIAAAGFAWDGWQSGKGSRTVLSMSGLVAKALAEEDQVEEDLRAWSKVQGNPFPSLVVRAARPARPFGADNAQWLTG